jgi:hypothetical protein
MRKNVMTSFLVSSQRNHSLKYIYIYMPALDTLHYGILFHTRAAHCAPVAPGAPPSSRVRSALVPVFPLRSPDSTFDSRSGYFFLHHLSFVREAHRSLFFFASRLHVDGLLPVFRHHFFHRSRRHADAPCDSSFSCARSINIPVC